MKVKCIDNSGTQGRLLEKERVYDASPYKSLSNYDGFHINLNGKTRWFSERRFRVVEEDNT